MQEEAKRLTPKPEVLRELYLKSGNQCAFPGCQRLMVNYNGDFVGQTCHIEAAMPKGERFNPSQTNEDRRSFDNLMLMCYDHHIETNNVQEFSVEELKQIKADHERKFGNIEDKIFDSINDRTKMQKFTYSSACKRMSDFFDWRHSQKELEVSSQEINEWVDKLHHLPMSTRQIFAIMIERSEEISHGLRVDGLRVDINELEEVTNEDPRGYIRQLEQHSFITKPGTEEYGLPFCNIKDFKSGWPFWYDLKRFTEGTSVTLEKIIVQLQFNLLD